MEKPAFSIVLMQREGELNRAKVKDFICDFIDRSSTINCWLDSYGAEQNDGSVKIDFDFAKGSARGDRGKVIRTGLEWLNDKSASAKKPRQGCDFSINHWRNVFDMKFNGQVTENNNSAKLLKK